MYKSFLIKYAEIAIKGKNRYLFEDALVSQINHALKKADGEFLVRKEQGRIYVDTLSDYDYDEVVEALKCVFGIVGICPVVLLEDEGFDKLAEEVISYIDKVYPDKHFTFKVNARRARKNYPMESMEINAAMGEKILDHAGADYIIASQNYAPGNQKKYLIVCRETVILNHKKAVE